MASQLCHASMTRCGVASVECPPSCSYARPSTVSRAVRHAKRHVRVLCQAYSALPLDLRTRVLRDGSNNGKYSFDILGLGQAMVDFSGMVDDGFLDAKQLGKGGRRVITVAERAAIIEELNSEGFELNAGGSLANTLTGCAVLGDAAHAQLALKTRHSRRLRVGMAGCIGDDHLGDFFRTQSSAAGVEWITQPTPGTGTGTVVVLTTPDAQRSFLSYPGTSDEVGICPITAAAIRSSRILVIEGYLWEFPNAAESIKRAISIAREAGTLVALTMADASVVLRHRAAMLEGLELGGDILFTNAAEAAALLGSGDNTHTLSAQDAALQLGRLCPVAVVTDGSKGSYITALGQLHVIPPHWTARSPVDTCGAGDAYAAGLLYGYLAGFDVWQMGEFASQTAATVISHHGPELTRDHADVLVATHPTRHDCPLEGALVSASRLFCDPAIQRSDLAL